MTGPTQWRDNHKCFACGKENSAGLKLEFFLLGENGLRSEYVPAAIYQGFENILHGGIISLLLDEVMVNVPYLRENKIVVTAELKIRLLQPAFIGKKLVITAFPDAPSNHRLIFLRGEVRLETGDLIATGKAKCVQIGER